MAMAAVIGCRKPSPFRGHFSSNFRKAPLAQSFMYAEQSSKISALFWESKKSLERKELDFSIPDFTIKGTASEGMSADDLVPKRISLSVISSISDIPSSEWDACNLDATGPEKYNPFLTHAFLSSLEETRCAVKETGWMPNHIVVKDERENILGVVPLYLKSHSYGEFVFDQSWAEAYYSFGSRYYPKFQCCVPFTPVTGPRILIRDTPFKDQVFDVIVTALKNMTAQAHSSSLHITFPSEEEWHKLKGKGFLQRIGMQYHWTNRNYKKYSNNSICAIMSCHEVNGEKLMVREIVLLCMVCNWHHQFGFNDRVMSFNSFDEFLMDMKQSKRKNIRQERKKISTQNLTMKRLRGYEIKAKHWDSFYTFYRNTTDNKWGTPYLTRDFFHMMASKMDDQVLLVIAEEGDELVAGALNIIGGDTLFGRLWGCHPRVYYPSLHFEACYYQAIEAAIDLNLNTVEAGAQGEHKIQRGYLPVMTFSCHYIVDESFRQAIDEFLSRESNQVKLAMKYLQDSGPFKDGIFDTV